jgi:sensor histidine kinase regulating citrate/malate metabolism
LRIQASELSQFGVQIQREYASRLPEVVTDKHKALQILLNLITNAKHACVESKQDTKRVTVRITNGDDRIRVAMIDNGVGIPTENLKKIFNHGFTTRKNGGHGFGLHSGALTAKELGGTLSVHSDGPGTGAMFTLEIPVKASSSHLKS